MEKAIFDTSVWINYYKNVKNNQTGLFEEYLIEYSERIYITPTIIQEFLQGVRTEQEFIKHQEIFQKFEVFDVNWLDISISSAKLYFDLRKKGVTIRKSTDCLIAQIAIENDVLLVHNDTDFELIAQNSSLRTFHKN